MRPRPIDYAPVVRAHSQDTLGLVVADTGDCLGIRDAEIAHVRRELRALTSSDLAKLVLPKSWLVAVLLCPGDDLQTLAAWALGLEEKDWRLIRFYHHPGVDLVEALTPWYAAGLDDVRADEVRDFASFHRLFGNDLNDQIYSDARSARPP